MLSVQWVEYKSIVKTDADIFYDTCSQIRLHWMERGRVEQDPSFKQIIPYIIIQTIDGKKTAVYKRKGSEARLHDLWSAGIGGHINPEDGAHGADSFKDILVAGMERELDEEFSKRPQNQHPVFQGIINEEKTDVGSVHLGAVFKIVTDDVSGFIPGKELVDFKWVDTSTLKSLNMELWSEFTLELLSLL